MSDRRRKEVVAMTRMVRETTQLEIRATGGEYPYVAVAPNGETVGFFAPSHIDNLYTLELFDWRNYRTNQAFYRIIDGKEVVND